MREKLLLHVCCAPCSSRVLEVLIQQFDITVYFYNPNITDSEEYFKRYNELQRFLGEAHFASGVKCIDGGYDSKMFFEMSKGLEKEPEKGVRCYKCYQLRMEAAAKYAKANGFDLFTTSLSISPHKNAVWINEIGEMCKDIYGIGYLYSDFKKKNGYVRSIELSKEYGLYRQDYCGCVFSKEQREKQKADAKIRGINL